MSLSAHQIQELARELDQATLEARELERITVRHPDLTIPDAYRIQAAGAQLRFARGEKQIGLKMGLTSEAKRKQMNLDSPCYGVLTDRMKVEEGSTFSLKGKIHPKIEPEIAFLIKKELRGVPTYEEALDACSGVCAAMEILDSRYVGFKYFSLPDVVADNSSSSYFVVGRTFLDPRAANWAEVKMVMEATHPSGEKEIQKALGSAISGDPVLSIIQQCELLHAEGRTLAAGSIVLAGAATAAVQLVSGMEIRLTIEKLGSMGLRVGA